MKSHVPSYDLRAPKNLSELLQMLHNEPGKWRPLAGGTDLMVLFAAGALPHRNFVSLHGLPELSGAREIEDEIKIGATTTFGTLQKSPLIQKYFPLLVQASQSIGAIAIQNRATLGGNIMNASPAADSSPVLVAYDAELELLSVSGVRKIRYQDFHTGYKKTHLRSDEIISAITLAKPASVRREYFRKVGTRQAQSISKVSLAGWVELAEDTTVLEVRIAMGSIAPTVLRCERAERALRGKTLDYKSISEAKEALFQEIHPIDDIRSNAEYRLRVSLNLLEEFLLKCGIGLAN